MTRDVLKIGFSACFFHPDSKRNTFKSKRLLFLEESMAQWFMNEGAMPVLLPRPSGKFSFPDLLQEIDGVLLQGGADVSPKSYHEDPIRSQGSGDLLRDQYEIQLIQTCRKEGKPVLGICRGLQILNVALGGTLYQDIQTQKKDSRIHRDRKVYDQLFHAICFEKGSILEKIYREKKRKVHVNSVHHQGIKDLAPPLRIEARCVSDGLIEAFFLDSPPSWIYGVQWHPEFQTAQNPGDPELMDPLVLLRYFLDEVKKRKGV